MNAAVFAGHTRQAASSPTGSSAGQYRNRALTYGAMVSVGLHVAAATAVIGLVIAPPALPLAPIMVSMIAAPVAEPLRPPEPEPLPSSKPAIRKPMLAPKPVLVAEKPAAEPAEAAPAPPPPAPAAVVAEAAPVPAVIPPRFDAAYLDNPSPPYPLMARRMGEQGKVMLRVLVNADGSAAQVELKTSSGSPRLDRSALDTVKRWRFVPAKLGTQAVTAWVLVPISFTLGA